MELVSPVGSVALCCEVAPSMSLNPNSAELPLEIMRIMLARLRVGVGEVAYKNYERFMGCWRHTLATGCSGSDSPALVLQQLQHIFPSYRACHLWSAVSSDIRHSCWFEVAGCCSDKPLCASEGQLPAWLTWQCSKVEVDPKKQRFIDVTAGVPIANNITDLEGPYAVNVVGKGLPLFRLERPFLFACGFSCTSISPLNPQSQKHRAGNLKLKRRRFAALEAFADQPVPLAFVSHWGWRLLASPPATQPLRLGCPPHTLPAERVFVVGALAATPHLC